MKKHKVIVAIIITIIFVSLGLFIAYTFPRTIDKVFDGILYRLGEKDKAYAQPVEIKIDGTYKKNLFNDDVFIGEIYINDSKIDKQELEFYNNCDFLYGEFYDDQTGINHQLSLFIVDSDFQKCVITIYDPVKEIANRIYGRQTMA